MLQLHRQTMPLAPLPLSLFFVDRVCEACERSERTPLAEQRLLRAATRAMVPTKHNTLTAGL